MRYFVCALVAVGLTAAACGGGPRPPMVPDAPDTTLGDGGADMPSSLPASATPAVKK